MNTNHVFESDKDVEDAKAEAAAAKAEAAAAKAETEALKAEKSKSDEELKKLKGKDMNFRRLESMTQDERDALTEKELELQKRSEALEDRQRNFEESNKNDWRNSAIERASRGDKEKAKAIIAALADVAGEDTDRTSIESRIAKAAKLAREDVSIDHVGNAFSFGGAPHEKQAAKTFDQTDAGADLAKRLGMNFGK